MGSRICGPFEFHPSPDLNKSLEETVFPGCLGHKPEPSLSVTTQPHTYTHTHTHTHTHVKRINKATKLVASSHPKHEKVAGTNTGTHTHPSAHTHTHTHTHTIVVGCKKVTKLSIHAHPCMHMQQCSGRTFTQDISFNLSHPLRVPTCSHHLVLGGPAAVPLPWWQLPLGWG